jgi:GNAT superfamily N-acetyltransferase
MSDWDRMLRSMREEFIRFPETSDGGHHLELDGVVASVCPAVPERSVANSVIYETEESLEAALPELARRYDDAGVIAWTVWVPGDHARTRELLKANGHVYDAHPAAMIAALDDVEPPRPDDPELDPAPRREDLGRVNDLSYGTGDAFQRLMGVGPADPGTVFVAHADGEPAATVVTSHHGGDCAIWWVATVPEARGRGLASGLMRRALADGRDRGCDVSTLQATQKGEPVYERLGYRRFGEIEMWERRKPG